MSRGLRTLPGVNFSAMGFAAKRAELDHCPRSNSSGQFGDRGPQTHFGERVDHASTRLSRLAGLICLSTAMLSGAAVSSGCAKSGGETQPPILDETEVPRIASYDEGLELLAIVGSDRQWRSAVRTQTVELLLETLPRELDTNELEQTVDELRVLSVMFRAGELRQTDPIPALADYARQIWDLAAKRGEENSSVFALAVMRAFGSPEQQRFVDESWGPLAGWFESTQGMGRDPTRATSLQRSLEAVAAVLPTPWVTGLLDEFYARELEFVTAAKSTTSSTSERRNQSDFLVYLRMRIHLRAGDLERAAEVGRASAKSNDLLTIVGLIRDAHGGASPAEQKVALLDLIERFAPSDDSKMSPWTTEQSWAIVHELAARALALQPDNAEARLALGRALAHRGQHRAAVEHYEFALPHTDQHTPWAELAEIYGMLIEEDAQDDIDLALGRLDRVEKFHQKAAKLWPDRPIEPGVSDSFVVVADGLVSQGRLSDARKLLDASIEISPTPAALELLGRLELRTGEWSAASDHFRSIMGLAFEDQLWRIHWEIRSRIRLGEVARLSDDADALSVQLEAALRQLETILNLPQLPVEHRSSLLVEHCRAEFLLGNVERGMNDFRSAVDLTPNEGSVYASPLTLAVLDQRWPAANEIYLRAMARPALRPRLKLYFSLWMLHFEGNVDLQATSTARQYVAQFEGEAWPAKLAEHSEGRLDFTSLLAAATERGEKAEAYFYAGLMQLKDGKRERAKGLLRRVLETEMISFVEYEMAQQMLVRLGP